MLAKTASVAFVGAESRPVEVEVDVADSGVPGFSVVGLPSASVREAEKRVRSAIVASDLRWPLRRVVANIAPGNLRKEGSHFDLALALSVLVGNGEVPDPEDARGWIVFGELGLDGSVRAARGAIAAAAACKRVGARGLICSRTNAAEARLVEGIEVVAVGSLTDCVAFYKGEWDPPEVAPAPALIEESDQDLSDVRGQNEAKHALEIAAAGGHNLLLAGPPGAGKTMLAARLPGILPQMSREEALEVTTVHSLAALMLDQPALIVTRPFRVPHHNISMAGLMGGGSGMARPGEVSLAHRGVLFLDEITLYRREVLESLRAPLESGRVRIVRSGGAVTYPCRFALVAAMNPCPCGYAGARGTGLQECHCTPHAIARYEGRLSGPLFDRFDLQMTVRRPPRSELLGPASSETSAVVRARVKEVRDRQSARYGSELLTNASAPDGLFRERAELTSEARLALERSFDALGLTGRGLMRTMRVGRTFADLDGSKELGPVHIGQALLFRRSDRGEELAS